MKYFFAPFQVPLRSAVSHQILGEFRSLTDICDVLFSLDIAIGFLSSTGGSPDMLLNHYLQNVLRMSQQNNLRSLKVKSRVYCLVIKLLLPVVRGVSVLAIAGTIAGTIACNSLLLCFRNRSKETEYGSISYFACLNPVRDTMFDETFDSIDRFLTRL